MAYTYRKLIRGKRVGNYRGVWRDAGGRQRDEVLRLPNGQPIRDKTTALAVLARITQREQHIAAGLIDPFLECAHLPIRDQLDKYRAFLAARGNTARHVKEANRTILHLLDLGQIRTVAEFGDPNRLASALLQVTGSSRTVNLARSYAVGFGEWCVRVARVLRGNSAATLPVRKGQPSRVRRALTLDEGRALGAISSPFTDFYAFALWSGLRKGEIRALAWSDLLLDGDRPAIRLRAETTKSRLAAELPIHSSLAARLRARKAAGSGEGRVFGLRGIPSIGRFRGYHGRPHLTSDLERAGIAYQDEDGRTVDLHALRTTFISWLGLYGVDPRAQVALARHRPQGVTMKGYQDFRLFDLWSEIEKLPPIEAVKVQEKTA